MGTDSPDTGLYPADRLGRAAAAAARPARRPAGHARAGPAVRDRLRRHAAGAADLPGVPGRTGDPFLVVPRLERPPRWPAAPAAGPRAPGTRPTTRTGWSPRLGRARAVGVSDRMWARWCCGSASVPGAAEQLASAALRGLRMRKSPAEVDALRAAGEAIDRVHAQVHGWLQPGRTERRWARTSPKRSWPRATPGPTS